MRESKQLMTDAEIRAIAESESDEQFWNRMFYVGIAQQVSDADDEEWKREGGAVEER